MASQNNNSQERIRSGEPRVCTICGDVLESSRALRNHRRYCTVEQEDVEMADGGETQIHSSFPLDNDRIAAEDDTVNANDLPEYSDNFEMDLDINISIDNSTATEDGKIKYIYFGMVIKIHFILTCIIQTNRYCIR